MRRPSLPEFESPLKPVIHQRTGMGLVLAASIAIAGTGTLERTPEAGRAQVYMVTFGGTDEKETAKVQDVDKESTSTVSVAAAGEVKAETTADGTTTAVPLTITDEGTVDADALTTVS